MDFAQVEKEVTTLRQDLAAGRLTEEQFKAQLREMMVEDANGNWWMVGEPWSKSLLLFVSDFRARHRV